MLRRLFAAARGLLYASLIVWLWWWVIRLARPFDSRVALRVPAAAQSLGVALASFGGLLALACVISFAVVGLGTPAPFDAPRRFVACGPYRWVRNPMYLGALLVILGAGLYLRSPSALLVAVVFVFLAHVFVLLYEEPALERAFGDDYRRYKASVNRWLPRRPSARSRQGQQGGKEQGARWG